MFTKKTASITLSLTMCLAGVTTAAEIPVLKAGDPTLDSWILPAVPVPQDNVSNEARIKLGRNLFFDPRLSGDGNMSCGTCHNPALGWSDGLATGRGVKSMVLGRASPTIINSGYNSIYVCPLRGRPIDEFAFRCPPFEMVAEVPLLLLAQVNNDHLYND